MFTAKELRIDCEVRWAFYKACTISGLVTFMVILVYTAIR